MSLKFERGLAEYANLSEQIAVWKQIQAYLSHFLLKDTEEEPRQVMNVTIPKLGSRQIPQEVLQRIEAEIEGKIEDLLEQLTTLM